MTVTPAFLYIMRHAEAAPAYAPLYGSAYGNDRERILTDKGRQDSRHTGQKFMSGKFRLPDVALVSSATRTRQTADCLKLAPPPVIEVTPALYHGDGQTYLNEICKQDTASLLVIGHNPSVSQLAHLVCRADASSPSLPFSFPTAALAVIEFSVPLYLCGSHPGRLKAFLVP